MSCLHTAERVVGPIKIRPSGVLASGEGSPGHAHDFDHTTIVFSGAVHVEATTPDGRTFSRDYKAPAEFAVLKEVVHAITATEDGTVYYCVYPHRDPVSHEISEAFNGWDGAHR